MGKEVARAFPIKRNNRGRAAHFTPLLTPSPILYPAPPFFLLLEPPVSIHRRYASAILCSLASRNRHGSRIHQKKGVAKDAGATEQPESELVARRAQFA